jgi:streptogramin lyase
VGEVLPETEVCDHYDNDCDGVVDEDVLSPCGDCDKYCEMDKLGPGTPNPFEPKPDNSAGVELTPEGWVTLSENSVSLHYIWIANSGESTVSKLDTLTGNELGRYYVCPDPSRTSVDQIGDCWVGCRGNGQVAKITNYVDSCVDLDGNGVVETSYDANGDGSIQPSEMYTNSQGVDECVAFVVKPSGASLIRAVGVDKSNHAWVGDWNNQKLYRLSPVDGTTVQTIQMNSSPYGLALDSDGVIWVAGRGGTQGLVRVDPGNGSVSVLNPPGTTVEPYGIIVAPNDDVWIGNCCGAHVAWRYNPPSGGWTNIPTSNRPRGIAASVDGYIYVANDESHRVAKINLATMQLEAYAELGGGRFPVGVAVDSQGYVWAVNQSSSSASKIDPATMQVILEHPVGSSPYTYSDMTGASFFNDIAPEGFYEPIYAGDSDARVRWKAIDVVYDTPPGTWIDVRFRMHDELEGLQSAAWTSFVGPFPPESFPLDLTQILKKKATHLQVHLALYTSNLEVKPIIKTVKLEYSSE